MGPIRTIFFTPTLKTCAGNCWTGVARTTSKPGTEPGIYSAKRHESAPQNVALFAAGLHFDGSRGGWLSHTLIYGGIQYEIDEQLSSDLAFVRRQLDQGHRLTGRFPLDNPRVEEVSATHPVAPVFTNTLEFDWRENQPVPVRRLLTTVSARCRMYRVIVKQAMGELNEIAQFLSLVVTGGFVVLLGFLILLNGWVARQLWQPFYRLTDGLRQYRLDEKTPTIFPGSTIAEFNAISTALNEMSRNLHR